MTVKFPTIACNLTIEEYMASKEGEISSLLTGLWKDRGSDRARSTASFFLTYKQRE